MKFRYCLAALVAVLSTFQAFPDTRLGADLAAPKVSAFLETLPLAPHTLYTMTDQDVEKIIALAADIHINVFEIIDCSFRYIAPRSMRIKITGSSLRRLQAKYDLGGDRVLAILAIDKLSWLETGARLQADQKDLDIYLTGPTETYIEIGTAKYAPRYGFERLRPLVFDDAYGITVKKMIFSTVLERLELFSPGKGAIYVKNLAKPKRWNLDVVTTIK